MRILACGKTHYSVNAVTEGNAQSMKSDGQKPLILPARRTRTD